MNDPSNNEKMSALGLRKTKKEPSWGLFVCISAISSSMVIGSGFLLADAKKDDLSAELISGEGFYDIDSAHSAEIVFEEVGYPVNRAVQINAADLGSNQRIYCVLNRAGELEIYTPGKRRGSPVLNSISMNNNLRMAARGFCNAAFSKID